MGIDDITARAIANASVWSSRNAKAVVSVVLLLTLTFGYGITLITTNVDVADVLPRGNPNTEAAKNLTTQFRSTFTQQVTFQIHTDEEGRHWEEDNAKLTYRGVSEFGNEGTSDTPQGPWQVRANNLNITDEVYVRAMEEMVAYIQDKTDFERSISIAGLYALINWTIAGGITEQNVDGDDAYALPGYGTAAEAGRYQLVDQGVKAAILETVDTLASPSWNHGAVLFMPAADNEMHTRLLGESIMKARDQYVAAVDAGETEFTVFGSQNPPLLTVDLPVANAHSSALVEEDMLKLMPMISAFIIVCLFLAFRNVRSIVISFTALGVGVVWTYGTMGYMQIPLNTLNMTIVPLIMGVGIDYAIHMISEFLEHKSEGLSDEAAFRVAGERAGLAMFIATLTTALGLVVMMVSPSLLMAQLGFLAAVAIVAIYILTIVFIPAALTLIGGTDKMGASFTPSRAMPMLAHGVTRARALVFLLLIGATFGAVASSSNIHNEAFGDPGKNYPADDPVRKEHEEGLANFYELEDPDVKANILTFEGPGILTPASIEYMREIERNLATKDRVISDTLRTLPFFVETWLTVKNGTAGAGYGTALGRLLESGQLPDQAAEQANNFPKTEAALRAEIDLMFSGPFAQLSSIIINHPTMNMAAMTFSVQAGTFDEAEEVWHQIWGAVAAANKTFGGQAPEGVHVAFVGNTATNYLFVAEEVPWLTYMSVAATIILFILVLLFTQNLKATIVATLLAGVTSVWWLGLLPLIDIGLAITLMLPLVFIFNIGTDYAVHIIWNLRKVGDAREVFGTVGKAILFSAITTAGSFAFFILIQNVAVSRTMVATTMSIFVIFAATILVIPTFYHVGSRSPALPSEAAPAAEAATPADEPVHVKAVKRPKAANE